MKFKLEWKMILITLISVIMMGFALSILNLVDWGTDSFTFMNLTLSEYLGIPMGTWQLMVNVVLFIPVILWARDQIGFGTIFNMVLVGYSIQFFSWVWTLTPLAGWMDNLGLRIAFMIPSLAVFVFSAATYMTAGLGTSPFDALSFLLSRTLPKIPFRWLRLAWDAAFIAIGMIFGGKVGIVTILMALFIGQTVSFVGRKVFGREKM